MTLADWRFGGISRQGGLVYGLAQVAGGIVGAVTSNLMFSLPTVEISSKAR